VTKAIAKSIKGSIIRTDNVQRAINENSSQAGASLLISNLFFVTYSITITAYRDLLSIYKLFAASFGLS
jgi:hypothetical protein